MFNMQPKRRRLALAVVAALATLPALPAVAQDAGPAPAQQEAKTLDKLVVTAQKREEALQDVPVVVTALSEEILKDTGVRDVKDLQVLVPGLTVTSTQSEALTTARIRGIGTVGDNAGLESSVGVVIDGVYRPRNGVGFGDLGELERIEVLKGPQGTLFGRNTEGGAVNLVSKAPTGEFGGKVSAGIGNFGSYNAGLHVNLPEVAARVCVAAGTGVEVAGSAPDCLSTKRVTLSMAPPFRVNVGHEPTDRIGSRVNRDPRRRG